MSRKRTVRRILGGLLVLAGAAAVIPLVSVFIHSFENYQPGNTENLSKIFYVPYPISGNQYYKALILNRETLYYFWNSTIITLPVLILSTAVSLPSGYALAKFKFPCKRIIFFCYVLVMLLPVQVGIVGTYIFFDKLSLLDTFTGVILPCAFSPFGAFLIFQFIKAIPHDTLESARLDGAGEVKIFLRIVIPQAKAGVASMLILILIDTWNAAEIPMLLLRKQSMHPMAIMLRYMDLYQSDIIFASVIIAAIPLLLIFALCRDALSEGIARSVPVKA